MKSFTFDLASESTDIRAGKIESKEGEESTHYSILDKEGNAVAVTTHYLTGVMDQEVFVEDGGDISSITKWMILVLNLDLQTCSV